MKNYFKIASFLICLIIVGSINGQTVSCGVEFVSSLIVEELSDHTVRVRFSTTGETSSTLDKIIVERANNAGTFFTKIGELTEAGGAFPHTYTFIDPHPCYVNQVGDDITYRIRFVSITGINCYSEVGLLNNIDGCPTPTVNPCSLTTIVNVNGPDVCNTGTFETYYATSAITWSITPSTGVASLSVDSYNPNLVTLTRISDGYVTLTATASSCTVSRIIPVGQPTVSGMMGIYSGPGDENEVCKDEVNVYDLTITPQSTINWTQLSAVPGGLSWAPQNFDDLMVHMWKLPQTAILRLSASNSCGTVTYDFGFKTIDCGQMFVITPNPSNGRISISAKKGEVGNYKSIDEISIYDFQNKLKFTRKYTKAKNVNILLSELKPGHYFIKIKSGDYSETLPLILQ